MRHALSAVVLVVPCLLAGCGGPDPSKVAPAPHEGVIVALPEDQGFVELMDGKAGPSKGRRIERPIVAFLLQADKKTAIESPPQEMVVRLDSTKDQKPITLRLQPDANEPAGSARFVSASGPYEVGRGGAGVVEVNLNGKSLKAPFRGR